MLNFRKYEKPDLLKQNRIPDKFSPGNFDLQKVQNSILEMVLKSFFQYTEP